MTIDKKKLAFNTPANSLDRKGARIDSARVSGAHVDDTSGGCLITG